VSFCHPTTIAVAMKSKRSATKVTSGNMLRSARLKPQRSLEQVSLKPDRVPGPAQEKAQLR
jgi:hypothetical protein